MTAGMDTAEPEDTAEIGEVIGGYALERLLGAGAMSRVFLGTHTRVGRKAAIKVLTPAVANDPDSVRRLWTEARVVNDIRHPNIIAISDFIDLETPRRVAIVMEYLEGPSLRVFREGKPLALRQAIGIALQLVEAIAAAHASGVIHRDLKPENLLLTTEPSSDPKIIPVLKVVDFGVAKVSGPIAGQKTATGMMIGTPAYMAPEQIAGRPPPSPATDVFAIGEIVYELVTHARAYPPMSVDAMIRTKLKGKVPDLHFVSLPEREAEILRKLVTECLAREPKDRPKLDQVKAVLLDLSPPEIPATIAEPPPPPPQVETAVETERPLPPPPVATNAPRTRTLPALLGALILIALGATGSYALLGSSPERPPVEGSRLETPRIVPSPTAPVRPVPIAERLEITSTPPGARVVRVEGQTYLGKTPLTIRVASSHPPLALRISAPGYEARDVIATDAMHEVAVDLLRRPIAPRISGESKAKRDDAKPIGEDEFPTW
jgi:serine/threonine-protein kinase